MKKELAILRNDPWLEPYKAAIDGRHEDVIKKYEELTASHDGSLVKFANAYKYYGLDRQSNGSWIFRDYLPNAVKVILIGDFSDWKADERYALTRLQDGTWEGKFPADMMHNGDLYKMRVYWNGGEGDRIPRTCAAWCRIPRQRYSPPRSMRLRNPTSSRHAASCPTPNHC